MRWLDIANANSNNVANFQCSGIPTGNEQGTYLALEVAGTEVRVAQLKLKGNRGQYSIHEFQYRIPDELIAGDNFNVMIDYITDCVDDFLRRVGSQDLFVYSMGVSFTRLSQVAYQPCFLVLGERPHMLSHA